MTAPAIFEHDAFGPVRAFDVEGAPWFVAADVARALGYRDAEKMTRSLADDEKGTRLVGTPGGDQRLSIVSLPGVVRAIAQRQTGRMTDPAMAAQVDAFQRWVFHDIVPAVMTTGTYTAPSAERLPQTPSGGNALVVRALQQTVEALAEQDRQITALYATQQHQAHQIEEQRAVTAALSDRVAAATGRPGWCTVLSFAKSARLKARDRATLAMIGRYAASITRSAGVEPEPVPDARWGLVNTYPEWALSQALDSLVGEGKL